MTNLRNLIIVLFGALTIYTLFSVSIEGPNFIPGFVSDLISLSWKGQVNLDLITFTTLSGLWVAWRHNFSGGGILMGVAVLVGAMMVFAPYLLYVISKSKGDFTVLLMGQRVVES